MKHKINPKRVPEGYAAITWFPWLAYYASQNAMTEKCIRHESIHGRQQTEMLIIFFYIWYGLEFLFWRYVKKLSHKQAYSLISFEREAYKHASEPDYLKNRKIFSWIKYL